MEMIPKLEVDCQNILGESVFWSISSQQVFWVDGFAPSVLCWSPSARRLRQVRPTRSSLGMIAETTDPHIVAMTDSDGITLFNLETYERTLIADPERDRAGIAYNDAKVDRSGRLWVGTYDASEVEPRGCLWVLENSGPPRLAESGLPVINGPAFSPDSRFLYLSDSIGRRVLAYEMDDNGMLGTRSVLAHFSYDEGLPDGLTVDSEGCIWVAHWDGGRVTRFSPKGERVDVVRLPAMRVTSVAFGGAELMTLFITTARYGLSETHLAGSPGSGSLFSVDTRVCGLATTLLPMPFTCSKMSVPHAT
jgi:D-xylonolactonase